MIHNGGKAFLVVDDVQIQVPKDILAEVIEDSIFALAGYRLEPIELAEVRRMVLVHPQRGKLNMMFLPPPILVLNPHLPKRILRAETEFDALEVFRPWTYFTQGSIADWMEECLR